MNIAWFTPYSRNSAIGRFSDLVVRELAGSVSVTLWVPEDALNRTAAVPVIEFRRSTEAALDSLAAYDLAVYNIGNHYPFHGVIYEFAARHPGVVILHDLVLHHFFAALYLEHRDNRAEYLSLLEHYYGAEAHDSARRGLAGKRKHIWESDDVSRWPLFEPAIEQALAVVTHSNFAADRIAARFPGPVFQAFLPYDLTQAGKPSPAVSYPGDKILVLSVGHLNRNKQTHAVLLALARHSELRERVHYVIIGAGEPAYTDECKAIVARNALSTCVEFLGHVDDAVLSGYLNAADICVNLRYPVTETGSASLAEEMLHGKAAIVTNIGCYTDIPDDCVAKVDPARGEEGIAETLRTLVFDAQTRAALGVRAKKFAEEHFHPSAYVESLLPAFEQVIATAPLMLAIDRAADVLSTMSVSPDMKICSTISGEFSAIFGIPEGGHVKTGDT